VRKELWVHLPSYDLVRGVMAPSAYAAGVAPRQLSFAGAVQSLLAFAPLLLFSTGVSDEDARKRLWTAVGSHRVGNRPDRVEPRAIKRRKNNYPTLNESRKLARQRILRAA
jgi:hypothetical protein